MEIHEIVHLLHCLWNHEPMLLSSGGKQKRDSRLPGEINAMFWVVCDRRDEEHVFFDWWETQENMNGANKPGVSNTLPGRPLVSSSQGWKPGLPEDEPTALAYVVSA